MQPNISDTPRTDAWCELAVSADVCAVIDLAKSFEREIATAQKENDELKRDKANLAAQFVNRAECATDNMEGANGDEFIRYETRMVCAIETLISLGIKFDPITGRREAIDAASEKGAQ